MVVDIVLEIPPRSGDCHCDDQIAIVFAFGVGRWVGQRGESVWTCAMQDAIA